MGGKALKNTYTERKNTEEFLRIGKEIQNKIYGDIAVETAIVKCYHTKADHGDLDLLIKITSNLNIDWRNYIQNTFNPNEIIKNDKVYSFDYEDFQIDFILISEESWITAQTYYNFDCVGNIMGKTYHKFGLSYGWEGLFYKYRNTHGTNSANISLTNDPRRIFTFGGYDYDRYLKGFDTLEEIFKFCIDSRYFDAEMFQMENLKSLDKKRNRKRGSYHLFLNYLKDNSINTHHPFYKDKFTYVYSINNFFPEAKLIDQLNVLEEKDLRDFYLSEKFNGKLVMTWLPELKGKELGKAIKNFKDYLGSTYETIVSAASQNELRQIFMDYMNKTN